MEIQLYKVPPPPQKLRLARDNGLRRKCCNVSMSWELCFDDGRGRQQQKVGLASCCFQSANRNLQPPERWKFSSVAQSYPPNLFWLDRACPAKSLSHVRSPSSPGSHWQQPIQLSTPMTHPKSKGPRPESLCHWTCWEMTCCSFCCLRHCEERLRTAGQTRRVGRTGSYRAQLYSPWLQNGFLPKVSPLWACLLICKVGKPCPPDWELKQCTANSFLWAWEKEFREQTPPLPPNTAATIKSQENQIRVLILPISCWRRKVSGAQAPYGRPHLQAPEGGAEMKEDTLCEQAPQTVNSSSTRWEESVTLAFRDLNQTFRM